MICSFLVYIPSRPFLNTKERNKILRLQHIFSLKTEGHGQIKLPKGVHLTNGEKKFAAVHLRMANITPFSYLNNGFFLVALTTLQ